MRPKEKLAMIEYGRKAKVTTLDEVYSRVDRTFEGTVHVDYKSMMINEIANRSVNALDIRALKGVPTKFNTILSENRFETEKARMGQHLSITGTGAFYIIPLLTQFNKQSKWLFKGTEVYSIIHDRGGLGIGEVFLSNTAYARIDNGTDDLFMNSIHIFRKYENYFENNQIKQRFVGVFFEFCSYDTANKDYSATEKGKTTPKLIPGFNEIPVVILNNKYNGEPDWTIARDLIEQYSKISNQIAIEAQMNKTFIIGNTANGLKDVVDSIAAGERLLQDGSLASKAGASFVITPGNFDSVNGMMMLATYYANLIYQKTATYKETMATGTNKHTTEVNALNQIPSENLYAKWLQRNHDYSRVMNELVKPVVNMYLSPDEQIIDEIKVKIGITEFEEVKLLEVDKKKSEITYNKSQASMFKSQADKTDKETEAKVDAETQKVKAETKKIIEESKVVKTNANKPLLANKSSVVKPKKPAI